MLHEECIIYGLVPDGILDSCIGLYLVFCLSFESYLKIRLDLTSPNAQYRTSRRCWLIDVSFLEISKHEAVQNRPL